MNTQELNSKKNTLLDAQLSMLNKAQEAHVALTVAEEESYKNMTSEIDSITSTVNRFNAISAAKTEIGKVTSAIVLPTEGETKKVLSAAYKKAFWNMIQKRDFSNGALAESASTSAADGSYLVPSQTDPTIPALAVIEASARKLSLVVPTEMDVKLPYQASKTVAAAKAESNSGGTNAFGTSVPTFN